MISDTLKALAAQSNFREITIYSMNGELLAAEGKVVSCFPGQTEPVKLRTLNIAQLRHFVINNKLNRLIELIKGVAA